MDKPTSAELAVRILALVRLDAQRLYERIKYRAPEYLTIYSVKRTRDHFAAVFKNRYDEISIEDLKFCDESVIYALDAFYSAVDKLRWYLYTTEDMPNKVDIRVHSTLKELRKDYENLIEAIDSQKGINASKKSSSPDEEDVNQVAFEDQNDEEDLDSTEDEFEHATEVKPVLFDVADEDTDEATSEEYEDLEEEDDVTSPSIVMNMDELEEESHDEEELEYSLDQEQDDEDYETSPSITFNTQIFPSAEQKEVEEDEDDGPQFNLDQPEDDDLYATIPELIPEKKVRTRIAGPEFDETPLKSKVIVDDIDIDKPDPIVKVDDFVGEFTLQFDLNEDEEDVATVVRPRALDALKKAK